MTPPPMNTTLSGNSAIFMMSSLVMVCSNPGIGKARAFEPVATTIYLKLQASSSTANSFAPVNLAAPWITS